jgi:hypothetical protein
MLVDMWTRARKWWSGLGTAGRRSVLVAAVLLFVYGFFQQRPAWNEYSRYDMVRAIVEEGTTRIDAYQGNTGDKAFYDGHWYSDKAPGSALLGVPVYALLSLTSAVTGGGPPAPPEAIGALAFVESGVSTTVLVLLLISFLRPHVGEGWAVGFGLAYGLASMALPFATMFFGHAASTAALFGSFFLLYRHRERPGGWMPALAGFLAGWAVLIELPVVLGVALLFGYALSRGRGTALRFVAGGLPLAGVLLAYDWLTFGSPLSIGYQYTVAFAGQNEEGIISVVWPSLATTGELLFGPRGLVRLAPWFALAPLGLLALRRRDLRFEVVLAGAVCAAFLTYNSGALNPFGGWTPGPRYLMPALPFATILVALAPRWARILAVPLAVVAAAIFVVATVTMPNAQERYLDPLFELWLPRLAANGYADTGAWLRWGLGDAAGLAVLALGLGFGLLATGLSFRAGATADRAMARGTVALGLMGLAFSFPFPPPSPVALGWGGADSQPAISVVELGSLPIAVTGADGRKVMGIELWARLENRGGTASAVRLQFNVHRPTGEGVWSAYYGDAIVDAGSRRTIWISWLPDEPPSGAYRYGFAVSDAATGAVYVQALAPQIVDVGP